MPTTEASLADILQWTAGAVLASQSELDRITTATIENPLLPAVAFITKQTQIVLGGKLSIQGSELRLSLTDRVQAALEQKSETGAAAISVAIEAIVPRHGCE